MKAATEQYNNESDLNQTQINLNLYLISRK